MVQRNGVGIIAKNICPITVHLGLAHAWGAGHYSGTSRSSMRVDISVVYAFTDELLPWSDFLLLLGN